MKLLTALAHNLGLFISVCSHVTQMHPVGGWLEYRQQNAWGVGGRSGRDSLGPNTSQLASIKSFLLCSTAHSQWMSVLIYYPF